MAAEVILCTGVDCQRTYPTDDTPEFCSNVACQRPLLGAGGFGVSCFRDARVSRRGATPNVPRVQAGDDAGAEAHAETGLVGEFEEVEVEVEVEVEIVDEPHSEDEVKDVGDPPSTPDAPSRVETAPGAPFRSRPGCSKRACKVRALDLISKGAEQEAYASDEDITSECFIKNWRNRAA